MESLALAALDPTSAGHAIALKTLQTLVKSDHVSEHKFGAVIGNPNAFKKFQGSSTQSEGAVESLAVFRDKVLPILTRQLTRVIKDVLQMGQANVEVLQDKLDMAVYEIGKSAHQVFDAIGEKGDGKLKLLIFSFDLAPTGIVRYKTIWMNVVLQPADLWLLEHHSESSKNFFGSKSRSWSTMSRLEQESISMEHYMQAMAVMTLTNTLMNAPEALRQANTGQLWPGQEQAQIPA